MKISTLSSLLLPFIATASFAVHAQEIEVPDMPEVEEITMDVVENARSHRHHTNRGEIRSAIFEFMLENGDITQEQIDALAAEREAVKAELAALREAGDEEAVAARIAELREEREANKEELRAYVDSHEDLSAAIAEQREQVKEQRHEQSQERNRDRDDRRQR